MYTMKLINMIFTSKNIITQTILTQLLVFIVVFVAQTSSVKLTFTDHTLYELIISTTPFWLVNLLTLLDEPKDAQCTILKIVQNLFLRFIASFVVVYVLTTFAHNLTLAILGLSNINVFTICGLWCTIIFTYLLGSSYLIFAMIYALIKSRDDLVERTLLLKVLNGFLVNLLLMSPLILKVGDELSPKCGVVMRGMMLVVFIMIMCFISLVYIVLGIKGLIKSLSHNMKKPSSDQGTK